MEKVFADLMNEVDDVEYKKKMKPKITMMMAVKKKPKEGMDEEVVESEGDYPKGIRDLLGLSEDDSDEEMMDGMEESEGEEMAGYESEDEDEDMMVKRMKMKMASKRV